MKNKELVIINVGTGGEVTVEAKGVIGKGCEALTRCFEESLGLVTSTVYKPEFTQRANVAQGNAAAAGGS